MGGRRLCAGASGGLEGPARRAPARGARPRRGGAKVSSRPMKPPVFGGGSRVIKASLGAAAAGVVLMIIGVFVNPARLAFAYLTAYVYLVSIAVSALLFLMTCHAMR